VPISSVVKNFRDGTITIRDGTGTPLDIVVQYEGGDFSATGFNQGNYEKNVYLDRGEFGSLRKTNRTFPTFTFSAYMTDLSDGTNENLWDMINKSGAFASAVSTLGASADVYTLEVILAVEGTNYGDASDHTLTLDDCVLSIDFAEGDPNKFTVSGTVYGTISAT
jgi:hypothetical protein